MAAAGPILLLDNRDSFVWNLAHAFAALGQEVNVRRSDAIEEPDVRRLAPRAIVLSPGPGRPEQAGISIAAVRAFSGHLPILGVCLGHQAICAAFGAVVERVAPRHGKTSNIEHDGDGLFAGVPPGFRACRYHSLAVAPTTLPQELAVDARTEHGVVMGVRHRSAPTFGVQFHPESFRTEHGAALLTNFLGACA